MKTIEFERRLTAICIQFDTKNFQQKYGSYDEQIDWNYEPTFYKKVSYPSALENSFNQASLESVIKFVNYQNPNFNYEYLNSEFESKVRELILEFLSSNPDFKSKRGAFCSLVQAKLSGYVETLTLCHFLIDKKFINQKSVIESFKKSERLKLGDGIALKFFNLIPKSYINADAWLKYYRDVNFDSPILMQLDCSNVHPSTLENFLSYEVNLLQFSSKFPNVKSIPKEEIGLYYLFDVLPSIDLNDTRVKDVIIRKLEKNITGVSNRVCKFLEGRKNKILSTVDINLKKTVRLGITKIAKSLGVEKLKELIEKDLKDKYIYENWLSEMERYSCIPQGLFYLIIKDSSVSSKFQNTFDKAKISK